jgi:chemotaxis regulatin CheY-phosphate phosphatase CheZ
MDDTRGWSLLNQAVRSREQDREIAAEAFKKDSKDRLVRVITTKLRTTMIGSISAIEEIFGFLWGQGVPRNQLTSDQRALENKWRDLRSRILNLGNSQIRALESEVEQYAVEWQRYHYSTEGGKVLPIFGIREDGSRMRLRYGRDAEGFIKTSEDE